ncbi:Aste57867_546 [Aphanomyces stellatus]|uniref:Aste57867_546 protein n=1 Tax=Aphanomyces stellatus TaxID=120398 RepID=A0A485K634_9STRA|nr:hypothetical protein As57867_000545 [Aphanomyces stellatus]VFT77771.1 Aste57867_546 [Aphanomyces stellatus]
MLDTAWMYQSFGAGGGGNFTNEVTSLSVDSNAISILPSDEITNTLLENLAYLDLDSNQLVDFPINILVVSPTLRLSVANNPIAVVRLNCTTSTSAGHHCPPLCAPACTPSLLANPLCNPMCNVSSCAYDNGACLD